jgi:hypothetical protein
MFTESESDPTEWEPCWTPAFLYKLKVAAERHLSCDPLNSDPGCMICYGNETALLVDALEQVHLYYQRGLSEGVSQGSDRTLAAVERLLDMTP